MRIWNEKQIDVQKKGLLLICLTACLLCVPFIVQIGHLLVGREDPLPAKWQFFLALCMQFLCGLVFYLQAYRSLRQGRLGFKTVLIILSTGVFLYSSYLWHYGLPPYFMVNAVTITALLIGERFLAFSDKEQIGLLPKKEADRFAQIILGIVVVASPIIFFTWWFLKGHLDHALRVSADIWVMACPCLLGLAMPLLLRISKKTITWLDAHLREDIAIVKSEAVIREAVRKMQQNVKFACFYHALGIPFAAMGLLHPVLVAFTIAMSFFSILTNSLLLYFWLPQDNRG